MQDKKQEPPSPSRRTPRKVPPMPENSYGNTSNVSSSFEDDIPEKTKKLLQWKAQRAAATPNSSASKLSKYREAAHLDYRSPTVKKYEEYVHQLEETAKLSLSASAEKLNADCENAQRSRKAPLQPSAKKSASSASGLSLVRPSKLGASPLLSSSNRLNRTGITPAAGEYSGVDPVAAAPTRWERPLLGEGSPARASNSSGKLDRYVTVKSPLKSFRFANSTDDIDAVGLSSCCEDEHQHDQHEIEAEQEHELDSMTHDDVSLFDTNTECDVDEASMGLSYGDEDKDGDSMNEEIEEGSFTFPESGDSEPTGTAVAAAAVVEETIAQDPSPSPPSPSPPSPSPPSPSPPSTLLLAAAGQGSGDSLCLSSSIDSAEASEDEEDTAAFLADIPVPVVQLDSGLTDQNPAEQACNEQESIDMTELERSQSDGYALSSRKQAKQAARDSIEASLPGDQVRLAMSRYYDPSGGGGDGNGAGEAASEEEEEEELAAEATAETPPPAPDGDSSSELDTGCSPAEEDARAAAGAVIAGVTDSSGLMLWKNVALSKPLHAAESRTLEFSPETDKMGNPLPSPPVSEDVSVKIATRLLKGSVMAECKEDSVHADSFSAQCWELSSKALFACLIIALVLMLSNLFSAAMLEIDLSQAPAESMARQYQYDTVTAPGPMATPLSLPLPALPSPLEVVPDLAHGPWGEGAAGLWGAGTGSAVGSAPPPPSRVPTAGLVTTYGVYKEVNHEGNIIQMLGEVDSGGRGHADSFSRDAPASASIVASAHFFSVNDGEQQMQRSLEAPKRTSTAHGEAAGARAGATADVGTLVDFTTSTGGKQQMQRGASRPPTLGPTTSVPVIGEGSDSFMQMQRSQVVTTGETELVLALTATATAAVAAAATATSTSTATAAATAATATATAAAATAAAVTTAATATATTATASAAATAATVTTAATATATTAAAAATTTAATATAATAAAAATAATAVTVTSTVAPVAASTATATTTAASAAAAAAATTTTTAATTAATAAATATAATTAATAAATATAATTAATAAATATATAAAAIVTAMPVLISQESAEPTGPKEYLTRQLESALKQQEAKLSQGLEGNSMYSNRNQLPPYFNYEEELRGGKTTGETPADDETMYYYLAVFAALIVAFVILASRDKATASASATATVSGRDRDRDKPRGSSSLSFSRASSMLREEESRILLQRQPATPVTRSMGGAAEQTTTARRSRRLQA
jgi:hypothetical protein